MNNAINILYKSMVSKKFISAGYKIAFLDSLNKSELKPYRTTIISKIFSKYILEKQQMLVLGKLKNHHYYELNNSDKTILHSIEDKNLTYEKFKNINFKRKTLRKIGYDNVQKKLSL